MTGDKPIITDLEQRMSATDPTRSFIVEAPAGSGKTQLLIRRYLRLLATVKEPEEILALTFTRKAASEMSARIIEALKAAMGPAPTDPYRLQTYNLAVEALKADTKGQWAIIENPSRLKVQTIDSLASSLAERMPILTRLGARPRLIEKADVLYEEAAKRTVALVEDEGATGQSVRLALSHLDNSISKLTQRLVKVLERRDQWLRYIGSSTSMEFSPQEDKELRDKLTEPIQILVEEALHSVSSLINDEIMLRLAQCASFAGSYLLREGKASTIVKLADIDARPGTRAESLETWRAVSNLVLTDKGEWRSPNGVNKNIGFPKSKDEESVRQKESFKSLLEDLQECETLKTALKKVVALPKPQYDEGEWEILCALFHLLPVAVRELSAIFAEKGGLDFQAVTMAARRSLGTSDRPTDLMLYMDYRLSHILIDEFQDTSWSHFDLMLALVCGFEPGDGRTLFIVGDPMQSIYLFKDTDVGLFLKTARDGFGPVQLERLVLKSNFRSQPEIVSWVNDYFQPAFAQEEDISSGAVIYSSSQAAVPQDKSANVHMSLYNGRDDRQEARDIVDKIHKIRRDGPQDKIAILTRTRSHLYEIVKALKSESIDFKATDFDPLSGRSVVQDLMSLYRSIKNPLDRVAWLALVAGPLCALDLADIHALCAREPKTPVWVLLNRSSCVAELSESSRRRLAVFNSVMGPALKLYGRLRERDLLESVWLELSGPAVLEDSDGMRDVEVFFDLVEKMESVREPFTIKLLMVRVDKLYGSHTGNTENPVEIMTMHKAKGLEFDHVILPGLGRYSRAEEKKLLEWIELKGRLIVAPIKSDIKKDKGSLYGYIRDLKDEKIRLERTRLFYVAVTRAKRGLYLYGDVTLKQGDGAGSGKVCADSRSLLATIEPSLSIDDLVPATKSESAGETSLIESSPKPPSLKLKRLPLDYHPPETAPDVFGATCASVSGLEGSEQSKLRPSFDWASEERKYLGTVLHGFFYRITNEGLDNWDASRANKERATMAALLRYEGLNKERSIVVADECARLLSKALADDTGRFFLSEHNDARSEYRLSGLINGEIKHCVVDRTFIDPGGVRWIVDYKSSTHEGGGIEAFLLNEKERYLEQMLRYKILFTGLEGNREIKCVLYYPALARVVEVC